MEKKIHSADLGFGCMRLPVLQKDDPASFDYAEIERLFDAFLEKGFTYFDTAYTYHGYHGEEAVRRALVERYPRDAFRLATKLPLRDFTDGEDMERIFAEQMEHCGVEYFDFLSAYGDVLDFVQLQINYADWEQPNVQSRRCLAIANRFHKPVVVMEPCKGGTLVNLPEEALALMREYAPKASAASWAMRYAASREGVVRVLSGMNTMEQVLDNTAVFRDFAPLCAEEEKILGQVREIIERNTPIPCTGCAYCTHGCPAQIAIPEYFALYNSIARTTGSFSSQAAYYNNISLKHGKASACIGCGQCEQACPQHLPIRENVKLVAEKFEGSSAFPTRR